MTVKISDLANMPAAADADVAEWVDVSDTSLAPTGTNKKGSWSWLKAQIKTYTDTLYATLVHTHAAADTVSGTFANARISQGSVTQHEAAITHNNIAGLTTGDPHTQYLNQTRGDARYVQGPASSSTDELALFDGTTGRLLKGSAQLVGNLVTANGIFPAGTLVLGSNGTRQTVASTITESDLITDGSDATLGFVTVVGELTARDDVIIEASGVESGRIGDTSGSIFIAHTNSGAYDPLDGAMVCGPGRVELGGASIIADNLKHTEGMGRQVYVAENGGLYAVTPPDTGWSAQDTDTTDYTTFGTGTGPGPWVELTGLVVNTGGDLNIGDRVDISCSVYVDNVTTSRSGAIGFAFDETGQTPVTPDDTRAIGPDYLGYVNVAFSVVLTAPIANGTPVTVYARRESGSHGSFGFNLLGSVSEHSFIVSVPAPSGGTPGPEYLRRDQSNTLAAGYPVTEESVANTDTAYLPTTSSRQATRVQKTDGGTLTLTPMTTTGLKWLIFPRSPDFNVSTTGWDVAGTEAATGERHAVAYYSGTGNPQLFWQGELS